MKNSHDSWDLRKATFSGVRRSAEGKTASQQSTLTQSPVAARCEMQFPHPCWSAVVLCHSMPRSPGRLCSLCWGARGSHKFGPGVAFVPTCQGAGAHMCAGHFAMFGQRLLFIHVCERKSSIALVSRPQLRAHFLSSSIIIYFHEWFGENNFLSAF